MAALKKITFTKDLHTREGVCGDEIRILWKDKT